MITIQWPYLIFIPLVIFLIYKIYSDENGFASGFYIMVLLLAIAIFGGILWW